MSSRANLIRPSVVFELAAFVLSGPIFGKGGGGAAVGVVDNPQNAYDL